MTNTNEETMVETTNNAEELTPARTGINWGKVALRDAHGRIDLRSTMDALEEECAEYMLENEVDLPAIANAVQTVFDKMGQAQNKQKDMNTLAIQALAHLQVPANGETKMVESIKNYLRGESQRFTDTQGAEGKVYLSRGPRGGVRLSSPTVVAEFKAMVAKKAAKNAPVLDL